MIFYPLLACCKVTVDLYLYTQRRQSGLKSGGVVHPGQKISIF